MEYDHKQLEEIAGRIYDLDAEVYRILGSGLGRVFNGSRDSTIRELVKIMLAQPKVHYLRSELALISNMARTIPNKADRSRVMTEYNSILNMLDSMPTSFAIDILDQHAAELNSSRLSGRFAKGQHLIICIGRTYGCAGTDIGFALADKLKINYYDSEIFAEVLERLEAEQDEVYDRASFAHHQNLNQPLGIETTPTPKERLRESNRTPGQPNGDAVFFNQSDLICEMAKKEDFIIMGRCADVILTNHHIPHVSIFINAPFELRARRVMETDNLTYKKACKMLKKLDRRHRAYYEFYTGRKWGSSVNYDLCINSASYGIEGSVQLIERIINQHTRRKQE